MCHCRSTDQIPFVVTCWVWAPQPRRNVSTEIVSIGIGSVIWRGIDFNIHFLSNQNLIDLKNHGVKRIGLIQLSFAWTKKGTRDLYELASGTLLPEKWELSKTLSSQLKKKILLLKQISSSEVFESEKTEIESISLLGTQFNSLC